MLGRPLELWASWVYSLAASLAFHSWPKSGQGTGVYRCKGEEVLVEAITANCSSLHPPPLVS